ncbi:MAG TPA: hypothetical protein DDY91_21165 [Planctomycetaceae bacterium]|nr:hypothetical protein [Planctomycetaceae bacterium]
MGIAERVGQRGLRGVVKGEIRVSARDFPGRSPDRREGASRPLKVHCGDEIDSRRKRKWPGTGQLIGLAD